jgi:hypothetical protein
VNRVVTLGDGKRVSLRSYLAAVRKAKANPAAVFDRGLAGWGRTSGAEVVREFRDGMHDRISQAVPVTRRGIR